MVQFFKGSADPRDAAYGALSQALGMGLGKGITSYQANKALDEVINDKSFEQKDVSARMGKLQSALAPYGDTGRELLQNRMQIEQQVQQEKQQAKQEKQEKLQIQQSEVIGKILNKKEVSDKERQILSPEQSLALAKHEQQIELQNLKNQKEKAPLGGLAGTPVTKEEAQSIRKVIEANPNATAEELELAFNDEGINPGRTKGIIETKRNTEKINAKNQIAAETLATEHDIKFHQESSEYEKNLNKEVKSAKKTLEVVEDLEKDIDKIKPFSIANILKGTGSIGDKIAKANLSKEQAKLLSTIPELLEGKKEIFGVRLSDADLRLVQDKIVDLGNSPEANKELLRIAKKYAKRSIQKGNAAENILEKHGVLTKQGKLRPLNYEKMVEKEHEKLLGEERNGVKMTAPNGRTMTVPFDEVENMIQAGAKRR